MKHMLAGLGFKPSALLAPVPNGVPHSPGQAAPGTPAPYKAAAPYLPPWQKLPQPKAPLVCPQG